MAHNPQSPAILIVDDDPLVLALVSHYMRQLAPAYTILAAEDGQSALRYLAEYPIPLMLTDYVLADMDGLQLTAAVKAASPTTYVILASAEDSDALKAQARERSVDLFLSKMDLLERLGDVLRIVLPTAPMGE
jgi:CheY-like chemotaxis protein